MSRIVNVALAWFALTVTSTLRSIVPPRSSERWLAGVAGGIARHLGVQPIYVRVAFVAFGLVGLAGYVAALVLTIDSVDESTAPLEESTAERKFALLLMVFGAMLLATELALIPSFSIPGALILFGAAALWDRSTPAGRSRLTQLINPNITGAPTLGRTLGGVAFLLVGMMVLLPSARIVREAGWLVLGVAATSLGALMIFGPWLHRLGSELAAERSRRARSDARAEVAAHLHDSVLQTLALIQRSADDPKRMVTLARSQERELRNWLYKPGAPGVDRIESALAAVAGKVESDHDVPIDVIVVGDIAVNADVEALVAAAREAMVNAAKHSGADVISVYAEVDTDAVDVWISDQGRGFDPEAAPGSGVGIRMSIRDRVERRGGTVSIDSSPDEGTEVHLYLPVRERVW